MTNDAINMIIDTIKDLKKDVSVVGSKVSQLSLEFSGHTILEMSKHDDVRNDISLFRESLKTHANDISQLKERTGFYKEIIIGVSSLISFLIAFSTLSSLL